MASSFATFLVVGTRTEVPSSNGDFKLVKVCRLTERIVEHLDAHLLQYIGAFFVCTRRTID